MFDRSFLNANQAAKFARHANMEAGSLKRQMRSARHILDQLYGTGGSGMSGMLLADDVGLGKTTIGAIVAWVAAGEGDGRVVRVLAPNMVMRQRWADELQRVLPALEHLASDHLAIGLDKLRSSDAKLHRTHIHITTQARAAARGRIRGDLIIVDEAHRSKSEYSQFRKTIDSAIAGGAKVLLLTATPMSIKTEELASLLRTIAGKKIHGAVLEFGRQIQLLYDPADTRDEKDALAELVAAADSATRQMQACVLRHSIEDLDEKEAQAFGPRKKFWDIGVPEASASELALLVRLDRMNRLSHQHTGHTNDPRCHVGRTPADHAVSIATAKLKNKDFGPHLALHLKAIEAVGLLDTEHPKMTAVARSIAGRVQEGEKVIVFCHHHQVAAEMTRVLARHISPYSRSASTTAKWHAVWSDLIDKVANNPPDCIGTPALRQAFVNWISSTSFCDQIGSWIGSKKTPTKAALQDTRPLRCHNQSIAEAMIDLLKKVFKSRSSSTVGVFRQRSDRMPRLKALPFGGEQATRVIGACEQEEIIGEEDDSHLFLQEDRPDLLMALFNSPFGPDVLVLTDRYSEGIDLHKRCRLLVHYELNPSPMRTIQREGRIRRIGNWASLVGKPVEYAMPGFTGTRDERMVEIMLGRLANFRRLLGGTPAFDEDTLTTNTDSRTERVLQKAADQLDKYSERLRLKP
jgi:ERCC4-related helicase